MNDKIVHTDIQAGSSPEILTTCTRFGDVCV